MKALRVVFCVALLGILFYGLNNAIDDGIARQDEMLCRSAEVSGNVEYLKKCACFYAGEEIECVNK